jgi:hypothetical protein
MRHCLSAVKKVSKRSSTLYKVRVKRAGEDAKISTSMTA